jgi:hypothetical protein
MKSKQYRKASEATWTDNFSTFACVQDDRFIYGADGSYQETDGPTKCSPNDPFIRYTSTWKFLVNETQISINNGSPKTIDVLDQNSLVLSWEYYVLGVLHNGKETYGH